MPIALLALALSAFAIGTTEFVTMGLLPQIAEGVDVSIPQAGHLISAYALGVVVGAPLLAALGARLPRRGLLVGLIASLLFFFFSREHKGALGVASKLGIWFLMIGFGAGYGFTVMSRISLLIGRFQFLINDWAGIR